MGEKKYHNEAWLREQYHDKRKTMKEIGDMCGVTNTTISEWMDKHGIEKRGQESAQLPDGKYTDREWLAEQYHGKGRSLSDMGDECGVTAATVMKWMDKHDIPRRTATKHSKQAAPCYQTIKRGYVKVSSKHQGEQFQMWIHQLVAIFDGADPYKVFSNGEYECHHVNGIPWDNRPDNIELLTASEHDELHAAERERADTGEFL